MKIALVGYGKMGHMIEQAAKRAGHEVVTTIDVMADDAKVKVAAGDTDSIVRAVKSSGAEGIIEFTHPTAVLDNVRALLPLGLPLVVGTTGWNDKHAEIAEYAEGKYLNQVVHDLATRVPSSVVSSVAGRSGAVTLTAADIGAGTFPADVVAPASANYSSAHIVNVVTGTASQTAGSASSYPNGTLYVKYKT